MKMQNLLGGVAVALAIVAPALVGWLIHQPPPRPEAAPLPAQVVEIVKPEASATVSEELPPALEGKDLWDKIPLELLEVHTRYQEVANQLSEGNRIYSPGIYPSGLPIGPRDSISADQLADINSAIGQYRSKLLKRYAQIGPEEDEK